MKFNQPETHMQMKKKKRGKRENEKQNEETNMRVRPEESNKSVSLR
jgi:hypothetical protein